MPIKFINQNNSKQTSVIKLEQNCVIKNVDPKKKKQPTNELSFALSTGQTSDVWLPKTQYNLLTALAGANDLDDTDDHNILTLRDLIEAHKRFKTKLDVFAGLGVKEFRCDLKQGVANITTKTGDVFRIDFETKAEAAAKGSGKTNKKAEVSKPKNTAAKKEVKKQNIKISNKTNTNKAKSASKPENKTKATLVRNNKISNIISKFKGGNININDVCDMRSVAAYTGISERYIRNILVGIEGKNNWPLTKAEYDGVKDRSHPKGYLTIGFGHTSLTGEPNVYDGMKITSKQAYQILANDIITAKKYAKYFGGEEYNKAPMSIKNAMIDLVFNKGPGAINASLKANLRNGYFHSAALRTWYNTSNVGLQKRNLYRFVEACKSLNIKNKQSAIKRFRSEHQSAMINVFKKDREALNVWNGLCLMSKYREMCF